MRDHPDVDGVLCGPVRSSGPQAHEEMGRTERDDTHVENEVDDVAPTKAEPDRRKLLHPLLPELVDDLVDRRARHVGAVLAEPLHEVKLARAVHLLRDGVAVEVCAQVTGQ